MTSPDIWPCPRLAPHPPTRTARQLTKLNWTTERPYRVRVLDYTCSCRTIVYELLASGGTYVIRRTHQTVPRKETYAGPWTRGEAERMWTLILTGEASLWSMSTDITCVRAGPTL